MDSCDFTNTDKRNKGNMLHITTWYKCWPFRFASSAPTAAGFLLSLVISVDVAQKHCCSGRTKAYVVSRMFQGMWMKLVSLLCSVQLMQVRFPLKIELLF